MSYIILCSSNYLFLTRAGFTKQKKPKKVDLLKMTKHERHWLIKEFKEELPQRNAETKLWQSLLEVKSLTINRT